MSSVKDLRQHRHAHACHQSWQDRPLPARARPNTKPAARMKRMPGSRIAMFKQYSSVKHVQPSQLFCFSNQRMMSRNTVTPCARAHEALAPAHAACFHHRYGRHSMRVGVEAGGGVASTLQARRTKPGANNRRGERGRRLPQQQAAGARGELGQSAAQAGRPERRAPSRTRG